MKKYYHALKERSDKKPHHPFYCVLRGLIRAFFPQNEVIWTTEKPVNEGEIVYVSNHTKIYAPIFFLLQKPTVRVWSNYYFLFCKTCWKHMKKAVVTGKRAFLKPLAFLLTPVIVALFRATEPIPVYKMSEKVMETFDKSMETAEENVAQIIFPERTENKVNEYVYEFNQGFPTVAQLYYEKTGKKMKPYPTYCAQPLRKILVGPPIEYDPDIPIKIQRATICEYLQNAIKELGDSLPEHEPPIYG